MSITRYDMLGFGPILLHGGVIQEMTEWGPASGFEALDELHSEIALSLARTSFPLNGKALRFLRQRLDLTQVQLGKALGYTDGQMVAHWERGVHYVPQATSQLVRMLVLSRLAPKTEIESVFQALESQIPSVLEFHFVDGSWRPRAFSRWSGIRQILNNTTSLSANIPNFSPDYNDSPEPLAA